MNFSLHTEEEMANLYRAIAFLLIVMISISETGMQTELVTAEWFILYNYKGSRLQRIEGHSLGEKITVSVDALEFDCGK